MHNSTDKVAAQRLHSFVERIERLHEERDATTEDIKEVRAEAKGVGFDTKIIDKVIKRRAMDAEKRKEEDLLLEVYEKSISGFEYTELGKVMVTETQDSPTSATIN
ncbi:MAG: DUF2312 domain-containing protein [Gammaproteobacteria bacterium]|nr:DUF2312 domain-containing protein [Gammaproteobacteria bacterium]